MKILRSIFPALYRRCPNDNYHVKWNHFCGCCQGNEFRYLPSKKRWVNVGMSQQDRVMSSSLSFSGALAPHDLVWPAVKNALIVAGLMLIILTCGYSIFSQSVRKAQKNILIHQQQQNAE